MKVALMNEFSQAGKNPIILKELEAAAKEYDFEVYNTGMEKDGDDPRLTYLHLGIQAFLLLNSKAVDFVVTGCGTGQGANMSLNNYPGVVCGLIIDPADAYLFAQINNGNAISLPYNKGFGWGAELNLRYIFEKLFSCERGNGYPPEPEIKITQNRNVRLLNEVKIATSKSIMEILNSLDPEMLKHAVSGKRFRDCFFAGSQNEEITTYIKNICE